VRGAPAWRRGRAWWLAALWVLVSLLGGCGQEDGNGKTIVLIGGTPSEGPGRHDYPAGVQRLHALLAATPQARGASIRSFENGWPTDPAALQGADTVVLYFDGLDQHPLRDPARRAQLEALLRAGVGLVALHQASTVPTDGSVPGLAAMLGAERRGTFDRSTETARLAPANSTHPVLRGVQAFSYRDEFYPTLHFAPAGVTPLLRGDLHVQYRDGAAVLEDRSETTTVGWAYERQDGGRAFGYTGAHFLAALEQPMLQRTVLNAILWTAGIEVPAEGATPAGFAETKAAPATTDAGAAARVVASPLDAPTFHVDRQRSGWHPAQPQLGAAQVQGKDFGLLWESPPLADYQGQAARLYASPLYLQQVAFTRGPYSGQTLSVVFAATSNGDVYAINAARQGDLAPGRILWHRRLATPCHLQPAPLDGVPTGVLSTPVIDVARARLYVTSCDPDKKWQAYALDIGSGGILPGWPVQLDEATFNRVNRNAGPVPVPPKRRFDFRVQRGALNLNADGSRLYITFGETETGWLVSVDTLRPRVASAFAAAAMPHRGSGGMWGAGGPSLDAQDRIHVVTGSGFDGYKEQAHDWTQSLLQLSDDAATGLQLRGTYTPFNHCSSARMDIDLGSGGSSLLPALDPAATRTPHLLVIGGKQGNAYLLDRDQLPGKLDWRPACDTAPAQDGSLLAPGPQPQFGTRGPLNVFGPYSEVDAALDKARARSAPAAFRDDSGAVYVYLTGNSKRAEGSSESVAPSLARLKVVTRAGQPAYLAVDRTQPKLVLGNPGSPLISSDGGRAPVVWILDENAPRSASLAGAETPAPVLYALDGQSLELLWQSLPGQLYTSGKYNEPVFAAGVVVVGTDRIQAFGAGAPPAKPRAPDATSGAMTKKDMPADVAATRTASAPPASAVADSGLPPATLFQQRCAICHDHPQGNIPPRSVLASRSPEDIVRTLQHGVMRAQAAGLSPHDIQALAEYLATPATSQKK
jgi:cytochrome c553/type 1 glutamine amidotransferase